MKDEELAEEWWNSWVVKDWNDLQAGRRLFIQAFLAGLRQTNWHDLKKDPNDLPPVNTTVLNEQCDKVEYIGEGKWIAYSEYYEANVEVDPPITWCEKPQYKE